MFPSFLEVFQHFQLLSGASVYRFGLPQFQFGNDVVHVVRLLERFDEPVSVSRQLEPVLNERKAVLVAKYSLLEVGSFVLVTDADAALLRFHRALRPLKAD